MNPYYASNQQPQPKPKIFGGVFHDLVKKLGNYLTSSPSSSKNEWVDNIMSAPTAQNDYTVKGDGTSPSYYVDPQKVENLTPGLYYNQVYNPDGSYKDSYIKSLEPSSDPTRAYTFGANGEAYNYAGELIYNPKNKFVDSQITSNDAPAVVGGGTTYATGGAIPTSTTYATGGATPTGVNGGATPTGTGVNSGATPTSASDLAFQKYLSSLSMGEQERDLMGTVAGLQNQARMDSELAARSGETSAFATGETERVNRNNALRMSGLADMLGIYQDERALNTEKARLEYERELAREKAAGESVYADQFTLGDSRYGYNTATRQYEKIATAPKSTTGTAKKLTDKEKKNNAFSGINALLSPGVILPDGTPTLDANGYITPGAFSAIAREAITEGVSRKELLETYGDKLFPGKKNKYEGYGLTTKEIEILK